MNWSIEALDARHERSDFRCGHGALDDYIRKYAGQHARKRVGRTYAAVHPGARQVLGYYTLSASAVSFEHVPEALQKRLPRYPLPVALLGKLAVDHAVQGQGLGEFLLMDALHRVMQIAQQMALFAMEVHALDETAKAFYRKYGFQPFADQPLLHLFLPLDTVKPLF